MVKRGKAWFSPLFLEAGIIFKGIPVTVGSFYESIIFWYVHHVQGQSVFTMCWNSRGPSFDQGVMLPFNHRIDEILNLIILQLLTFTIWVLVTCSLSVNSRTTCSLSVNSRTTYWRIITIQQVKGILWDCWWSTPSIRIFPTHADFFTEMHS